MVYDPTPWDDVSGLGKNQVKGVKQFAFGFESGGPVYEIVLGEKHRDEFIEAFERFIKHARPTGLKMPILPANLRAEFPETEEELSLLPPPSTPFKPAPAARKSPVLPLTDEEIPPDFWVTPKSADHETTLAYKAFRERIYEESGQKVKQGFMARKLGYDWARKHPDALREWVNDHPETLLRST